MSLQDCSAINSVVGSVNLCVKEVTYRFYGYNVTEWVAIAFTALFGLSAVVHAYQAIRSRMLFLIFTVTLCALDEFIGWGGRLWSASAVEWSSAMGGFWDSPESAYMGQIATLIIGPAFLSAVWYIILGRIITALGPQYSRFRPKVYTITFVTGDVTCLLVQAAGGGLAASSSKPEMVKTGSDVMVSGVILQMVVMILYSVILVDFVLHYIKGRPVRNKRMGFKQMNSGLETPLPADEIKKARILLIALVFSTVLIFVRSIYRTIELLEGWNGPIITNESLFIVLDGIMVFGATAIFHFVHPGKYMPVSNTTNAKESDSFPLNETQRSDLPTYALNAELSQQEQQRPRQSSYSDSMEMPDMPPVK